MAELVEILGGGESVTAAGETITVRPIKFGQLPQVLKHVGALFSSLEGDELNITRALTEGGEDVLAILAIVTGKPREWFDSLEMDEGIALLTAAVRVNSDVFQKKFYL